MKVTIIFALIIAAFLLVSRNSEAEVIHHTVKDITENSLQPLTDLVGGMSKGDTLCLTIDSGGGNVAPLFTLAKAMVNSKAKIVTLTTTRANSSAAMLLLFGSVRMIGDNAEVTIHRAYHPTKGLITVGENSYADLFHEVLLKTYKNYMTKDELIAFWTGKDVNINAIDLRKGYAPECIE